MTGLADFWSMQFPVYEIKNQQNEQIKTPKSKQTIKQLNKHKLTHNATSGIDFEKYLENGIKKEDV